MSEEDDVCHCHDDKPLVCPICHQEKEYLVKVSVEFPNPLEKKYPDVVMEPYTCDVEYCHLCVFKIFKSVYPHMHKDLRYQIMEDDESISEAIKHGKIECACCGTKMDDANGFSCQTKEELK